MAPNIFMVVQEDYITIGTEVYRISEMYPKYWPQSVPDAKPPPNVVFVQVLHTMMGWNQKKNLGKPQTVKMNVFFSEQSSPEIILHFSIFS